jgi:hypothetical protein
MQFFSEMCSTKRISIRSYDEGFCDTCDSHGSEY